MRSGICLPVSVKTRLGIESPEEFPPLLEIFNRYPMAELIIHPRVRRQFYKGMPDREAFALAARRDLPLVYNGDLFTAADCAALQAEYPGMPMMLPVSWPLARILSRSRLFTCWRATATCITAALSTYRTDTRRCM